MALLMGLSACTIHAQEKILKVHTVNNDPEMASLFTGASVNGVSLNGRFAVGSGSELTEFAFIWDRETGEFTQITGSLGDAAEVYGVSNDGTVVGCFADSNNGEVSEGGIAYTIPGFWKDGQWTPLETELANEVGDMNGEARTISADGRIITGYIRGTYTMHYNDPITGNPNAETQVIMFRPAVWIDGKLQAWENLPYAELLGQGMWLQAASEDGNILAGVYEHPSGSRSPSVWTNGSIHHIYGEQDKSDEDRYFFEGNVGSVSPNGKYVAGYWLPRDISSCTSFVYDTENHTTENIDGMGIATIVTDNGNVYGMTTYMGASYIRTADFCGLLTDLLDSISYSQVPEDIPQTILGVSEDEKVLGGWYNLEDPDFGYIMMPSILEICDPNDVDGIASASHESPAISISYGHILPPMGTEYTEILTAGGQLMHKSHDASAFDLSALPQGVYVVRCKTAQGWTSLKIAR